MGNMPTRPRCPREGDEMTAASIISMNHSERYHRELDGSDYTTNLFEKMQLVRDYFFDYKDYVRWLLDTPEGKREAACDQIIERMAAFVDAVDEANSNLAMVAYALPVCAWCDLAGKCDDCPVFEQGMEAKLNNAGHGSAGII